MFWYGWLIVTMIGYLQIFSKKYAWVERLFKDEYCVKVLFEGSDSKPIPRFVAIPSYPPIFIIFYVNWFVQCIDI